MGGQFFILTLGCKVNQYESQALREAWIRSGAVETDDPAEAGIVLVNSCAVTASAVADLRQSVRRLHRSAPKARIIITGCAAARCVHAGQQHGGRLEELPGVMALVDPQKKDLLLPLFDGGAWSLPADAALPPDALSYMPLAISAFRRARPVVKVQDGCSHGCAYCIVPLARGAARSRSAKEVIAETARLFAAGYAEVMISGINLRQYACGAEGCGDFWALFEAMEKALAPEWAGRARLRLSSLDPGQLTARGIDVLASSRLLCHHLHISLQSGSPSVLGRMGRGQSGPAMLMEAVGALRKAWPVMGLGADVLTGFPGETEAEATENLAFIRELPLTYAHVFPYSERPGTRAATMPGAVPVPLRRERAAAIRACIGERKQAFWRSLDSMEAVMASTVEEGGLLEWYVPCRLEDGSVPPPHSLVPVRITGADAGGVTAVRR